MNAKTPIPRLTDTTKPPARNHRINPLKEERPDLWKSSFIVPLHKSGNKSEISNYRGICKLSALPKLFEEVIVTQVSFNIEKYISPYQHGFLKGKSTTTNLLVFVAHVIEGFSNGLSTDTIYTDSKKAFDYVNHLLMVFKSRQFGFSDRWFLWLESYLSNRTQRVVFKNNISREILVTSGVPQGSHLGPLLFLIFINDLPTVIQNSRILLFADDVKLFYSFSTDCAPLQNDLNNLAKW